MTCTHQFLGWWLFGALHSWSHFDQEGGGVKASSLGIRLHPLPARSTAAGLAAEARSFPRAGARRLWAAACKEHGHWHWYLFSTV